MLLCYSEELREFALLIPRFRIGKGTVPPSLRWQRVHYRSSGVVAAAGPPRTRPCTFSYYKAFRAPQAPLFSSALFFQVSYTNQTKRWCANIEQAAEMRSWLVRALPLVRGLLPYLLLYRTVPTTYYLLLVRRKSLSYAHIRLIFQIPVSIRDIVRTYIPEKSKLTEGLI